MKNPLSFVLGMLILVLAAFFGIRIEEPPATDAKFIGSLQVWEDSRSSASARRVTLHPADSLNEPIPDDDLTVMSTMDLMATDSGLSALSEMEANELPNPEDDDRVATDLPPGELTDPIP